jgi:hypothetical protein
MRKLPNWTKINQAAPFALVGWYLMTSPLLAGTTNVLDDKGVPLWAIGSLNLRSCVSALK